MFQVLSKVFKYAYKYLGFNTSASGYPKNKEVFITIKIKTQSTV